MVPELKQFRLAAVKLQQEILPVTYEGMSLALKERNQMILSFCDWWLNNQQLREYLVAGWRDRSESFNNQSLRKENERLASKLLSLQSELSMEIAKGEHFRSVF